MNASRLGGLRLAVTTFTVLPMRAGVVDRRTAGRAMLWAPVMGALTGLVAAAVFGAATWAGAAGSLAAALAVGATALFTRGLHLDGLADVADGLGSARPPERALEIMKRSDIGPFGVAAMIFIVLIQVTSMAGLASATGASATGALATGAQAGGAQAGGAQAGGAQTGGALAGEALAGWVPILAGLPPATWAPAAIVTAYASGRLAVTWACLRGVPAARPGGLGAMVAGTVRLPAALGLTVLLTGLAIAMGGPALGVVALAAPVVAFPLLAHVQRRLGGVTGDVLGAVAETGTAAALAAAALAGGA